MVEYPERTFDFELFIASSYDGVSQSFFENDSMWYSVHDALTILRFFLVLNY